MIRQRIFIPTVCAERGSRSDAIGHLLNRYPFHLCIENDEIAWLTVRLMDAWVQDGEAWDTREEADEALRESWLDFVPVSFEDVRWALCRRIMAAA